MFSVSENINNGISVIVKYTFGHMLKFLNVTTLDLVISTQETRIYNLRLLSPKTLAIG